MSENLLSSYFSMPDKNRRELDMAALEYEKSVSSDVLVRNAISEAFISGIMWERKRVIWLAKSTQVPAPKTGAEKP